MAKHFVDETAEFKMPSFGRHAGDDLNDPEATQRFDPGFGRKSQRPSVPVADKPKA